jgi:hypothetical protein
LAQESELARSAVKLQSALADNSQVSPATPRLPGGPLIRKQLVKVVEELTKEKLLLEEKFLSFQLTSTFETGQPLPLSSSSLSACQPLLPLLRV